MSGRLRSVLDLDRQRRADPGRAPHVVLLGGVVAVFLLLGTWYFRNSFDSDWLFPVSSVDSVERAMRSVGSSVHHERISSPNGHDTFLIDYELITEPVRQFLTVP